MDRITAAYMRNILIEEMGIASNSIWIRDQNVTLPKDDGLFIVLGMVDSKTTSVTNTPFEEDGVLKEKITVIMRENIQIDLFSRNTDALTRRWEIQAAFKSVYSTQVQEANKFKIFSLASSFVNSSATEGAEIINKFSIIIPVLVWYAKSKAISTVNGDYYDSFTTRADDANTTGEVDGLFEFEITGE